MAAPMIDFYVQNTSNVLEKLISPEPPKLHARSIQAPDFPACALLRNKGVRIADMTWAGTFPGTIHAICAHCRRSRPEIEEQLDGYTIAVDQDVDPEHADTVARPQKAPDAAKGKARSLDPERSDTGARPQKAPVAAKGKARS